MTIVPVFQIVPVPPGAPKGGLNCQCAVAAMCVDHATGGKHRPSAADVRALCRNEDGTPDVTEGTNLRQVDDAINRGWAVDLDVVTPLDFEVMWKRLGAEPDLVASVSVQYEAFKGTPVYASRTGFLGAHQVLIRRRGSTTDMFDPLADGRGVPLAPVRISRDMLRTAAGRLKVNSHGLRLGLGKVYVGFVRAPKPAGGSPPKPVRYSVRFEPGAFFTYGVQGGVAIWRNPARFRRATSAPCAAPERIPYPTATSAKRRLVKVTAGVLQGTYVEPGRSHVELVETR